MNRLRLSQQRGHEDKGWIESYHSFSFETYYDPDYLGYRSLCVLNEENIKGGKGLGEQVHKDMEVLTYVVSGVLEYKDNLGNTSVIREGELFLLSAGTGITHSEYNLSHHIPVHFFQLWFTPNQSSLIPTITQRVFSSIAKWGQWCLIASQNGREGSLRVHQDVNVYATVLDSDGILVFEGLPDRYYWIQVLSGTFLVQKEIMHQGDGFALSEELRIEVSCLEGGELLLIDQA